MTFSWKEAKSKAVKMQIRINKTLANGNYQDHAIRYPDEVREATAKNYIKLTKRVTEEVTKYQDEAIKRRLKSIGK